MVSGNIRIKNVDLQFTYIDGFVQYQARRLYNGETRHETLTVQAEHFTAALTVALWTGPAIWGTEILKAAEAAQPLNEHLRFIP